MAITAAFVIGVIFGLGILISGMCNPAKVLNFFDIAGSWDPSLAFVMAGGLLVNLVGYRLVLRRRSPVFAPDFELPATTPVTARLLAGSAVFGIGWGLSGFCPGGLVPVLALGKSEPLLFFAAMIAAMSVARQINRRGRSALQMVHR